MTQLCVIPQLKLIYRCNAILPQIFMSSQSDHLNDYLFKFVVGDLCFGNVKRDQAVDVVKSDRFFKFFVGDSRSHPTTITLKDF